MSLLKNIAIIMACTNVMVAGFSGPTLPVFRKLSMHQFVMLNGGRKLDSQLTNDLRPIWVTNNFDGPELVIDIRNMAATADYLCNFRLDADHCIFSLLSPVYREWACEYAKERGGEHICTSRNARKRALLRVPNILQKIADEEDGE